MARKSPSTSRSLRSLHQRAEAALSAAPPDIARMPPEQIRKLVHDLQVHQIELKLQNEDLRETQLRLAQSRDRFNDLYDFAPVGYVTLDKSGVILEANLPVCAMLGLERRKVLGCRLARFVARPFQDELHLHQRAVFASDKKQTCELLLRSSNGTPFFARMESIAMHGPISDGHLWQSAIIDITDRKEAEEALARSHADLERRVAERTISLSESEDRLRSILNTVEDAIITTDPRGTIIGVNPAAARIFGYTEPEMIGQNVRTLLHPYHRDEYAHYIEACHRTAGARGIGSGRELRAQRKNGDDFPIDLFVTEVDHLHLFTTVIRDTTQRKKLEAEVLRISNDERLRVAADLHDGVCQNLTGLIFVANALWRDLQEAGNPHAERARTIQESIATSAEQVRHAARGINPVVADGEGLMHALRQLAKTTAQTWGHRCVFECPKPVSIADPTTANHLYRIAQEAIHNAVRHGHAKRINVRLSLAEGAVNLAVVDNGCGIAADAPTPSGMGLRVMKYRAGLIGGQLAIQPRHRGGTEVLCRVAKPRTRS